MESKQQQSWFLELFLFCFVFLNFLFIFFIAVLGLRFCARAFSSCGKRGPLFIAVRGPLTIAASLVAEHRLQTRRLSSCGARAQLLRGVWDLPRPGLEPVSPALAGRLSTTAPPGKPFFFSLSCTLAQFLVGHLAMSETLLVVIIEEVLLASSGWGPGMLLYILQCPGRPHNRE